MTKDSLVSAVIKFPAMQRLTLPVEQGGSGLSVNDIESALKDQVDSAVKKVASSYPWDFAMRIAEETSVTDQANYELEGLKQDCDIIHSVMYGDDDELLTKQTVSETDEMLTRLSVPGCYYWTPIERTGKFPRIRIIDAPSSAGTITYRYWRNNVGINEIPAYLEDLLEYALAKKFVPGYNKAYDNELTDAIRGYNRSGRKFTRVNTDPHIMSKTNKRHTLHGWS